MSKSVPSEESTLSVKYFIDNFSLDMLMGRVKPSNRKEELAYYYFEQISELVSVFDRLARYEKYFKDFFPPAESGISESEAIEYHLRSYIEDFYILQERVRKITNQLTNDLPNYNIANQDEVRGALRHLSDQIHLRFKKITSGLRREHVHEKSITELDLVTGKFLSSLIDDQMPVPTGIMIDKEMLKNRRAEVVNASKEKHIKQASENSVNLRGMQGWFLLRFVSIFSSLNGHSFEGDARMANS